MLRPIFKIKKIYHMETIIDQQLSDELQEMFLQNKLWLSDILFYEDEVRFFRNMFDKAFSQALNDHHLNQVQHIDTEINALKKYLSELKNMVLDHRRLLESLLDKSKETIGLDLINENTRIIEQIKDLFLSVQTVKAKLVGLVESAREGNIHLLGK